MDEFDFDGLGDSILDRIINLQVIGTGIRGPLELIPANICRLKGLKHLNLSNNQIRVASFNFTPLCSSELESLDLSNNFISEVPIQWISQLPSLKSINLSNNNLTSIPYSMFSNIGNIENFDASSNRLTTFELWLIQIKKLVNFSNNPITHFTNVDEVDLSHYQSNITEQILLKNMGTKIAAYDNIFEMYNRCTEINSNSTKLLMETIRRMNDANGDSLLWDCSCERYYLQEYVVSIVPGNDFSHWMCHAGDNLTYTQKCNNQSSFDFESSEPRLCSIKNQNHFHANFLSNISDLGTISEKIYDKLLTLNESDDQTAINHFAKLIDYSNTHLSEISVQTVTETIQNNFQNIVRFIENFLQSIDTLQNISFNSVGILSVPKNRPVNSYSRIVETSISVDLVSIQNLSETHIYIFYDLPSSFFLYAQKDQNIIIVSPIVGIHLPSNVPRSINISFIGTLSIPTKRSGKYSCVFWQHHQWNDSGCTHSADYNSNRHSCFCNHATSFALIFIPHQTTSHTSIPAIVIAIVSIVCFSISIILSINRQAESFRHISIANIFTLSNSIVLFTLLTTIIIHSYQSSSTKPIVEDRCSTLSENLAIATYFFLILTFASKTLLGIDYFLTIFFHFISVEFKTISNGWFYGSFLLAIAFALIPTVIIVVAKHQWTNLFNQYDGVCWFHKPFIFRFVSIPILIFIGLNVLIIVGITIRILQFLMKRETLKKTQKRMTISIMIWITLCMSLGITWIFGPFLDFMINEKSQSSSTILQSIFGFFNGLEGVWVLAINIFFYLNQNLNRKNRQLFLNKIKK
ncbi:unnamed protein product [Rotaria socialis]|uniref:Uncharacterized protein n=1 Tax=Rotaria socialis TaxID=392032 RepID=A0A818HC99_9BILA|nr:unnamed protein product [Rotaria socialis]CAF4422581.1 unnamed protein product [Rotaria socialis]